jgi:branched-chain amino acid transport system ATP-binding protein
MELLEVHGVSRYFGGLKALDDVVLRVHSKEILGLIGPNGSGKTTLFDVITGFLRPSRGEIFYNGRRISGLAPHLIAKYGIIRTYQKTSIFTQLTVAQNIAIGHHIRIKGNLWHSLLNTQTSRRERKKTREREEEILEFLNMHALRDRLAINLTYGDQRRLEIAIALAARPDLLLLDEPAAGLNPEETKSLMGIIRSIRDQGTTIFLVEHDMKVVMGICKRIVVLNYGKKIAEGRPQEITENGEVIKVYLGEELEYA